MKGENKSKKATTIIAGPVIINRKRLCNVLFLDKVHLQLVTRAKSLTKEELTFGIKAREELFRLVADEYNNPFEYNEDAWPSLTGYKSKRTDPSGFAPIDWKKAKSSFQVMFLDYEKCFQKWKQSGFHEDFPDEPKKSFLSFPIIQKAFSIFMSLSSRTEAFLRM